MTWVCANYNDQPAEVTLNCGDCKGIPPKSPDHSGLGIIQICPGESMTWDNGTCFFLDKLCLVFKFYSNHTWVPQIKLSIPYMKQHFPTCMIMALFVGNSRVSVPHIKLEYQRFDIFLWSKNIRWKWIRLTSNTLSFHAADDSCCWGLAISALELQKVLQELSREKAPWPERSTEKWWWGTTIVTTVDGSEIRRSPPGMYKTHRK